MFNKVILVGNLTRDIELRYTPNNAAVANTAIAVTRNYTGANGEKKEEVCFIDITFFGRAAEIANQYLNKGSRILIEGRLKFDQWQDQNGQNRSRHSVVVENMKMLGGGSQNNQNQRNQGGYQQQAPYQQNSYQSNNQGYSNNQNYSQNRSSYQNRQANSYPPTDDYKENTLPDIDVDGDIGDIDEEIPF